eukprot:SAG25_NODE_7026_length_511_cov_0.985437_2_plen_20_part_01
MGDSCFLVASGDETSLASGL